jgi:hypothetical protein
MPKPVDIEYRVYGSRIRFENFENELTTHAEFGWTLVSYTTERTRDTDELLIASVVFSRKKPK